MKYFAYGSNMAQEVIQAVCPSHQLLGAARLPGYRMAFTRRSIRTGTGVADIVLEPDHCVWGVLYDIAGDDLEHLDRKEGSGWAYARTSVTVYLPNEARRSAFAYTVLNKEPDEIFPAESYKRTLVAAARERYLPSTYVAELEALGPR